MNRIETQRKIFGIIAVLMLLSVVLLIAVIPVILQDNSPGSTPIKAASGALIGIALHLLVAYWFGIRLRRGSSMIRNEVYILSAVGFFFLGFMMLDGAYAFMDDVPYVSYGMFVVASCDLLAALVSFAAAVVLIVAFIRLRKKKKA